MSDTPSLKRTYNLGLKAVPKFEILPSEVIEYYERHPDRIPVALMRGFVIEQPFLSVIATINLGAVKGKKTASCFINGWSSRDSDFDRYLDKNQPNAGPCVVSAAVAVSKSWRVVEAVRAFPGAPQTDDTVELGFWAIRSGHTLTLPQIEELRKRARRSRKTGLRTDTWSSLFLVETGDLENPVSVVNVVHEERDWIADISRLDVEHEWGADNQLFIRNLDASKLGPR